VKRTLATLALIGFSALLAGGYLTTRPGKAANSPVAETSPPIPPEVLYGDAGVYLRAPDGSVTYLGPDGGAHWTDGSGEWRVIEVETE
jgi:hypothetical protein